MELRRYAEIVWRRAWIIVGLVVLTAAFSLLFGAGKVTPVHQASLRVAIGLTPEERGPGVYTYDRYYTWLTSEYLVDSFAEVVKSQTFAQDVSARLTAAGQPLQIPAGAIQGSTVAEQVHRILTVRITWGDEAQLRAIADAAVAVLKENNARYFAQLGTAGADVVVLDMPTVAVVGPGLREKLDIPLRLFLALLAGIGLAFLLDYLDLSVRSAEELEALGVPVLGRIPPLPGRRLLPWGRRLP
jgi:capsular polysaccharide biosynthesis protein